MEDIFVFTGTVTYAMRGADALKRNGYKAEVRRRKGDGYGCGYGIYIKNADIDEVIGSLTENGVKILGTRSMKNGISG